MRLRWAPVALMTALLAAGGCQAPTDGGAGTTAPSATESASPAATEAVPTDSPEPGGMDDY